jgi:hypothetical protein
MHVGSEEVVELSLFTIFVLKERTEIFFPQQLLKYHFTYSNSESVLGRGGTYLILA